MGADVEDDGDDVVADVSLSGQLLAVVGSKREEGGHVKHDLVALVVLGVNRPQACRVVFIAQAGLVPVESFESDPLANKVEELVECVPTFLIVVHFFFRLLAVSAVHHPNLQS